MIWVTGHRGARGLCPENTLAGFQRAADLGCHCVELDVHLTADGELAVIHDERLERTTDGTGPVGARTLAQLKRLDAGEGQAIPSLAEVIELLRPRDIHMQIELKGPGTEDAAPRLALERGVGGRVTFTSFHHPRVLRVKQRHPDLLTGILVACYPIEPLRMLEAARADNLHVHHERIDADLVRLVRGAGRRIVAWGDIVEVPAIDRLIGLRVDAIGSDRPDRVLERLREKG